MVLDLPAACACVNGNVVCDIRLGLPGLPEGVPGIQFDDGTVIGACQTPEGLAPGCIVIASNRLKPGRLSPHGPTSLFLRGKTVTRIGWRRLPGSAPGAAGPVAACLAVEAGEETWLAPCQDENGLRAGAWLGISSIGESFRLPWMDRPWSP